VAEEAPAPCVTPELRKILGETAIAIARAVDYVGVGTVEFPPGPDLNFYFLEMTCRIQGGHAVHRSGSRARTLVRWQILVAAGGVLPLRQEEIPSGATRSSAGFNAEDPDRSFAPSFGLIPVPADARGPEPAGRQRGLSRVGTLALLRPLLSKLSTWGPDRAEAIARMHSALSEYRVGRRPDSVAFHKALLEHKPFLGGDLHTGMLDHAW